MRRNTHSWCWGVCLSCTSILSWPGVATMSIGMSTGTAEATPVVSADKEDAHFEQFLIPKEYRQYLVDPLADSLGFGSRRYADWFFDLALDVPSGHAVERGDLLTGMWAGSEVVLDVLRSEDLTQSVRRYASGKAAGDNSGEIIAMIDEG